MPALIPPDQLDRLAADLAARWQAGERPLAESLLDRHPDLRHSPEAALELIAEELALREEFDAPVSADALAARFPQWDAQVRALVECQRALAPPKLPEPGDRLGDFRLLADLGRGAHGRVYLASQPSLGFRPVVLKVSPDHGGEHLSLARLQHTNIVPLYSAHDFPDRGLRAICLPFFGGATLADARASRPRNGKELLAAVAALEAGRGLDPITRGPAWSFLERADTATAACWVGAGLADGLQHAHDRGLLHGDVKPSNVLLAGDGVPMLLDFHLARPPLSAGKPAAGAVGGTLGYMAPELAAAVAAVRAGQPVPAAVDGRADVFSLGVLLAEWVRDAGRVSAGLADLLARATAADPAARYPSAGELAADLRRHLADLPLKGVTNRSLVERWGKWRRRRPFALPLAFTLTALLAGAGGLAVQATGAAGRAAAEVQGGRELVAKGRFDEAEAAFNRADKLLAGLPFASDVRADVQAGQREVKRGRLAAKLFEFAETLREQDAAARPDPKAIAAAIAGGREVWSHRAEIAADLADWPGDWRDDLLDAGRLTAALEAKRAGKPADLKQVQAEITALTDSPAWTSADDMEYRLRGSVQANALLAAGRESLADGQAESAAGLFEKAARLAPKSVWPRHYLGAAAVARKRPAEAVAAFSECVVLAPNAAWCRVNRGLAFLSANDLEAAIADFTRAIELDVDCVAAYLGRADAYHRTNWPDQARADLQRAKWAGATAAELSEREAVLGRR